MLNKQDITAKMAEFLAKVGMAPEELAVGSKGAMVMVGLADLTNDIDASVSDEVFDRLLSEGYATHSFTSGGETVLVIEVTEDIDVHRQDRVVTTEIVDGVCVETMHDVLLFKKGLNRPKDQADILVLERHLKDVERLKKLKEFEHEFLAAYRRSVRSLITETLGDVDTTKRRPD